MLENKTYMLNCDVCDTRKMSDDLFEQYEKIMINADAVIVNDRSKAILNKYPVKLNVDSVINAEDEIDSSVVNGNFQIKKSQPVLKDTILIVNGSLIIEPDTEEVLKKYIKIIVNGNAKYPQSIAAYVTNMTVNGENECYPDDCIVLNKVGILDKYFSLRAKNNAKYYAEKEIVIADSDIDVQLLKDKNITFVTKKVTVLEDKISDVIDMFDENVEISVIPNECGFINEDVTLNEFILNKYGSKLYINGDLKLNNDSTELIKNIEYLKVCGTVSLLENQKDEFMKINADYNNISVIKGKEIKNKLNITIDEKMLELIEEGVLIKNCAKVSIKKEVSNEEILKLLQFKNCAKIICSEEQKSAVEIVSTNVVNISKDEEQKDDVCSPVKSKLINAENYIL